MRDCGWVKEADSIEEVLSGLPTGTDYGNDAEHDAIRAGAERIRTILAACFQESSEAAPKLPAAKMEQGEGNGGPEKESVDAEGEVTNPRDSSAYVAASVVRLTHTPIGLLTTHKQLVAVLSEHPEIKRWHPSSNRLCVHLPDWLSFVKRETEQRDRDGFLANPAEIRARAADIRHRNLRGK